MTTKPQSPADRVSETKWTPGPWTADIRGGCLAVYPAVEEHDCLSGARDWAVHYSDRDSAYDGQRWSMSEEARANAHLIAASPRMAEYIAKRAAEGDRDAAEILAAARGEGSET